MKTRRFSLLVALLGASVLAGGVTARACKYCWSAERAASEYTQQSMLPRGQVDAPPGTFPLDSAISQFKPAAAPAPVAMASSIARPAHAATHYADAGLLGLAAVGGVFCWRTRRKPGSER